MTQLSVPLRTLLLSVIKGKKIMMEIIHFMSVKSESARYKSFQLSQAVQPVRVSAEPKKYNAFKNRPIVAN